MKSTDESIDRLYENLTLDPIYVECTMPPHYVRGKMWITRYGSKQGPDDVVYKNADGKMHRIYGPAYISTVYKYEIWYLDNEIHRIGGPAFTHKNLELWYMYGKLHRLDGPAVNGSGIPKEYWIGGQQLSPKFYKKEIERRTRKGLIK